MKNNKRLMGKETKKNQKIQSNIQNNQNFDKKRK